jgi:hypothetical protein
MDKDNKQLTPEEEQKLAERWKEILERRELQNKIDQENLAKLAAIKTQN